MKHIVAISTLIIFIFLGCGSDSSDSSNDSIDNNFTIIRGTVPGTLIEAFCYDGAYYKTTSIKNDTNKHPFELRIPKQSKCRLVMTTNEEEIEKKVITMLSFSIENNDSSIFSSDKEYLDLGYIDLALNREDASNINDDGVINTPYLLYDEDVALYYYEDDLLDNDNNGILNIYEDDDNDGLVNYDDSDDDNDGIDDYLDYDEDNDGVNDNDFDGDGIINELDVDDDNDGIADTDDNDYNNDGVDDFYYYDEESDEYYIEYGE